MRQIHRTGKHRIIGDDAPRARGDRWISSVDVYMWIRAITDIDMTNTKQQHWDKLVSVRYVDGGLLRVYVQYVCACVCVGVVLVCLSACIHALCIYVNAAK